MELFLITRHIFFSPAWRRTLLAVCICYNEAWPIMRAKGEHKASCWIIMVVGRLDHNDGEKVSNYVLQQCVGSFG